jgi:hypothetical protein
LYLYPCCGVGGAGFYGANSAMLAAVMRHPPPWIA